MNFLQLTSQRALFFSIWFFFFFSVKNHNKSKHITLVQIFYSHWIIELLKQVKHPAKYSLEKYYIKFGTIIRIFLYFFHFCKTAKKEQHHSSFTHFFFSNSEFYFPHNVVVFPFFLSRNTDKKNSSYSRNIITTKKNSRDFPAGFGIASWYRKNTVFIFRFVHVHFVSRKQNDDAQEQRVK